jgi:hypothetical protein
MREMVPRDSEVRQRQRQMHDRIPMALPRQNKKLHKALNGSRGVHLFLVWPQRIHVVPKIIPRVDKSAANDLVKSDCARKAI